MSIKAGIQSFTQKFSAIKKLQEMGLMNPFSSDPVVCIFPELWLGKDHTYVANWCKNVLLVWAIKYPNEYKKLGKKTLLEVRHIESDEPLCRFDEANGLVLVNR